MPLAFSGLATALFAAVLPFKTLFRGEKSDLFSDDATSADAVSAGAFFD